MSEETPIFSHPVAPVVEVGGVRFKIRRPGARAYEQGRHAETRAARVLDLLREQSEAYRAGTRADAPDATFEDSDLKVMERQLAEYLELVNDQPVAEIFGSIPVADLAERLDTEMIPVEMASLWVLWRSLSIISRSRSPAGERQKVVPDDDAGK